MALHFNNEWKERNCHHLKEQICLFQWQINIFRQKGKFAFMHGSAENGNFQFLCTLTGIVLLGCRRGRDVTAVMSTR